MLAMTLHGIILVQLGQASTRATHSWQIDVDLLPPDLAGIIIFEADPTVHGSRVQRGGGNGAGGKLQTEDSVHGIIDKGPRGIPHRLVLTDAKEAQKLVEDAVRLFELNVKTQGLEQQILVMQDGIPPLPKLLGLLVHHQIGLLLSHPTTGHNKLAHFAHVLLHFSCQEERCRCCWVRVHPCPLRDIDHAVSHKESLQVHGGRRDGELW